MSAAFAPGSTIGGRFTIEATLGDGGLGPVFRALDRQTGQPVALRIVASDIRRSEVTYDLLRSYVQTAAKLIHKNVGQTFGIGEEGSAGYIVSEYIEGQSLRELLQRKRSAGRTFSYKGAYNVLAHVCNALEAAHHAHVIHGLIGPGSILINRTGRLKVVDFGFVRALTPGSKAIERLADSYALSPQMHRDPQNVGIHTDLFSAGVVLFEMLAGRPPQAGERLTHVVPEAPSEVDDVLSRCFASAPEHAFRSAKQLKAAFYAAIESSGVLENPAAASASEIALSSSTPSSRVPAAHAAQSTPVASQPAHASHSSTISNPVSQPPAGARKLSIVDLLNETTDTKARWLVRKDSLDYGPFGLHEIKQQLYQKEFTANDIVVDQDTAESWPMRKLPQLAEFVAALERHQQEQAAENNTRLAAQRDKRRKFVLTVIVLAGLLVVGGAATIIVLKRMRPETREKIVYRDRVVKTAGELTVRWNAEPEEQRSRRTSKTKQKRRRKRKKGKGAGAQNDTAYLDMSKSGGDELLSQQDIQRVMQKNMRSLSGCILRHRGSARSIRIDFGVRGSGKVSGVKVNKKSTGPLQRCLEKRMRALTFRQYDGTITRASFTVDL